MLEYRLRAHPTAEREAIEHRPPDRHEIRTERQAFENILAAADPTVDHNDGAAVNGVGDARQYGERTGYVVQLAPPVIGYLHARAAVLHGRDGELRRDHAFQQHRQAGRLVDEFQIIPIEITLDGFLAVAARLRGKISGWERRTEVIAA